MHTIKCKELAGKQISEVTIYADGDYGPEVNIEFTDKSNFNVCLRHSIEAKLTTSEGGQPHVLCDYSFPACLD